MSATEQGVVRCARCARPIRTVITVRATTRNGTPLNGGGEDYGRRCARKHASIWRDILGATVTVTRWRVGAAPYAPGGES